MGRPINKHLINLIATTGQQIQVSAWVPGDSQARVGSILRQRSTNSYVVDTTATGGAIGKCTLVNTTAAAEGQMTVKVFPFGAPEGTGATLGAVHMRVKTVAINAAGSGYAPGDVITVVGGTGTAATATVDTVDGLGAITGITLLALGDYTVLPSVTGAATTVAPAGGTLATVDLTFEVLSVGVSAGGVDYQAVTITFGSGTATAHGVVTSGALTSVVIDTRGSYTVIPTVAVAAVSTAVVEYAKKIAAHLVSTFIGNVYKWRLQPDVIVAGEANIESA